MIIQTASAEETIAAGESLAKLLRPGDVIAYRGGMGAGKTTFTVGVARGLGLEAWVSSPTFALVHEYEGRVKLCHFDMFRISTADDLFSTGFFDYLDQGAILAVEWSENIEDWLPKPYITVELCQEGDDRRQIIITGDERF